jgi:hypothetical protein
MGRCGLPCVGQRFWLLAVKDEANVSVQTPGSCSPQPAQVGLVGGDAADKDKDKEPGSTLRVSAWVGEYRDVCRTTRACGTWTGRAARRAWRARGTLRTVRRTSPPSSCAT